MKYNQKQSRKFKEKKSQNDFLSTGRFFLYHPYLKIICFVFVLFALFQSGCKAQNGGKEPISGKPGEPVPASRTFDVLIVKSPGSLRFTGWKGEMELKGAEAALYRLGIDYAYVEEEELVKEEIPCKILLLPNTRCMNLKAVEGIRKYVQNGGKLIATYMSAYRDENNQLPFKKNNFLLSDVYGADFYQWVQNPSRCEYIKPDGKGKPIALGRNQAMMIKPHKDSEVLAVWLKENKKPETIGNKPASAVIYNPKYKTIYCGEDLFAPENSESPQVLAFLGNLMEKLEPGIVKKEIDPKETKIKQTFSIPGELIEAVKPTGEIIRIGINRPVKSIFLSCKTDLTLSSDDRLFLVKTDRAGESYMKKTLAIPVKANEMIYLDSMSVYGKEPYINVYNSKKKILARCFSTLKVRNADGGEPVRLINLKLNGTYSFMAYRGELQFTPKRNGTMKLVNQLSMDEYISGVVPKEMPATYPEEALKAMSVVARTFAQSSPNKHKSKGFDLCDSVHCQVYRGVMGERLKASKAVADTSGEMIYFNGKPAPTTFHSTCGGYGASASSVWSGKSPVLAGGFDGPGNWEADLSDEMKFKKFIDDPPECFCKKSGRFRWVRKYSKDAMKKLLDKSIGVLNGRGSYDIGKLYSIEVKKRAPDGRVQEVEVVTSTGTYKINKDKIRWITSGGKISTGGLSSTLFYITSDDSGFTFTGGGWGHGVGMCQEGARGMAETGINYPDIVKHYYRGVEIIKK